MLDLIAYHVGCSTVGQVNFVAVGAVFSGDAIVEDVVHRGARLQQVADVGVVSEVVFEQQRGAMADIEVVRKPITRSEFWVTNPILIKLGVFDHNVASSDVALQYSILVVVKIAIQHGKVLPVHPNAGAIGAVSVIKRGVLELQVLDHRVAP